MHITARQEQFSKAYVRAIAAVAGFNICTYDVDNDSVDLGLVGNAALVSTSVPRSSTCS